MSGVRGGEAAGTPALQLPCSGWEEEVGAGTCAAKAPQWELRPLCVLWLELSTPLMVAVGIPAPVTSSVHLFPSLMFAARRARASQVSDSPVAARMGHLHGGLLRRSKPG